MQSELNRCYLIDGPIYFFRSWFALPQDTFHDNGLLISGALGFTRFLLEFLGKYKPKYVVIAFDESLHQGYRNTLYSDYKKSRELPDEHISFQLHLCQLLAAELGVTVLKSTQYEADDLLAGAAELAKQHDLTRTVISKDKDLVQIANQAGDAWWAYPNSDPKSAEELSELWGVHPAQLADLLALAGDTSDDIPGLPGVGPKTAASLLQAWRSIDEIYRNLEAVRTSDLRGAKRLADKLAEHERDVRLYQKLTRLYPAAAGLDRLDELAWRGPQNTAEAFFEANNLQQYDKWLSRLKQVYAAQ